jgi:alpha-amylase/alpha-mannosidase (GH57 family)
MKGPLYVTFLWHMHQPYYRNIETGKFILPWVRMHAVKDYYDMLSILDKYPKIKQNFNLVPSLLLQLEEYTQGTTDIFMDLTMKHPSDLNDDERVFILFNFFMANWGSMIYPYPRYSYLLKKRGENTNPDEIKQLHRGFSESEIRDLQVWFNLTWIDPEFIEMFPELKKLKNRGENFTEEEKKYVIKTHLDIIKMIIPKYREMQEKGRVELSTTPFYHPILPLVYDTDTAKKCMPGIKLDFRFSQPEDVEAQVKKGIEYFKEKIGMAPAGMWPSEGSVSEEAVSIMAKCGVKWAATDEEILKESLKLSGDEINGETIYRPYSIDTQNGRLNMVFRNHFLSDLIGFTYQGWNPREAADNFIHELYNIKNSLQGEKRVVNVILDGENCWEYYANDGKDFLNALYEKISANSDFETVTISEAIEKIQDKPLIKKLFPGSWINHDFYIWIGHEQDQKSWKLLKQAREDLVEWQKNNGNESDKLRQAWESVFTAEGSDWNWWYGDDHSSKNDTEFDNLYRLHLMNVYKITGMEVPLKLFEPIAKGGAAFELEPSRYISPVIDGHNTDFYEWKGAGVIDLTKEGGAMHKSGKFIQDLYYGFDHSNLYLRLDAEAKLGTCKEGMKIKVEFVDGNKKAVIEFSADDNSVKITGMEQGGVSFAAGDILEAAVPFNNLAHLAELMEVKCAVFVNRHGSEIQRIPEKGFLRIALPDKEFELYNWKA